MSTFNSLLKGELGWLKDNSNLSVLKLDGIEYKDLRFPNEESYRGGWKDNKPEGEGFYTWADGSTYEGAWHAGLKHGWGKYCWPNGACYLGEWRDGFMQGYGTFESPDGARYSGNWQANLKHGIGKKVYANGDLYEGLWRNGKAEGPGRYVWHNGNQYDGEWRAGKMHGQGTLKWITGERYDGEWSEGQEDGIGVFTWRDGSTYEGFWEGGKKAGVGVFRPAPNTPGTAPGNDPSSRGGRQLPGILPGRPVARAIEGVMDVAMDMASAAAGMIAGESPPPRAPMGSPMAADAPLDSPSAAFAMHRRDKLAQDAAGRVSSGVGGSSEPLVFVCQYDHGKLQHEEALSTQDLELIFGPAKHTVEKKGRRLRRGRRRQVRLGETIYKGHRSYDLMLNLQLGIRYTITTLNKLPAPSRLSAQQYTEKVWLRFPREGSEVTPPHPSNDFKWKDYCTSAFKRLRTLFGIDNSQYILSICGDQALREMASPGKSGSVFFISHDDQFMIKTMHKEEIKLLLSMLPKYMNHVEQNPETLLTRFYGVHRVKPSHGRKVRFVVMNNVFRTDLELHAKYDLKGSTYGRTAGPKPGASAIRKDLDLDVAFRVDAKLQTSLAAQLAVDCSFLEDIHVMDYSLLLGLHRRHLGETSASPLDSDKEDAGVYLSAEEQDLGGLGEEEGSEKEEEEADEGEGGTAFHEATGGSMAYPFSGSLLPGGSSGSAGGQRAREAAENCQLRRSTSGLKVAPTSDSDADVTRSMHSMTIEQQQASLESRSPSFMLKGLTWRSFTAAAGRRPSQTQLAPALGQQPPQALQPPASAQITPRVQPSILPTPRLAAATPPPLPLANGSSTGQPLLAPSPSIMAALHAAAAADAEEVGEGERAYGEAGDGQLSPEQQQQLKQQQADAGELTWRSDAVQMPEQHLLPDGIPVSPTASMGTAGSMPRPRGSNVPALGAIPEQPGSAWDQEEGEQVEQRSRHQGAVLGAEEAGGNALLAAAVEQTPEPGLPCRSLLGNSLSPVSPPAPESAAVAAAPNSPASSSLFSSTGTTPTSAAAAVAAGKPRGLPLPGGVPRIALQSVPRRVLQPERESNDWMHYAESVSDAGLSGRDSDLRSTQRAHGDTPDNDATSTPISSYSRCHTMPLPLPDDSGTVDVGRPLEAHAAAHLPSPGAMGRGVMASAPATARSPVGWREDGGGGAAGAAVHRLAHAAGPEAPPRGDGSVVHTAAASPERSPCGSGGRVLGRTTSAPAGQLLAAATVEGQRRHLSHQRGMSMMVGREASVVDLTSPEAVAVAGRINTRLTRRVTDQLVQDLVKLARYRMVGAVGNTPSAHHSRMPTMVLAARHMRRSSGGTTPLAHHHTSSQDEGGAVTPGGMGGGAAATEGGAGDEVLPRRLGIGMPAVALSLQAGQVPEEVVLFFGIIDFLQEYNMRKMLEHSFKAVVQDAKGISVVEPRAYAKRFLKFMERVFPPSYSQQQ